VQQAEAAADRWQQAAERQPDREAGCITRVHRNQQQPTVWLELGSQRGGQAPGGLRIGPNQARESDVEAGLEAGG
jgi:hypothetical protein